MNKHNTEKTVCPFCASEWVTAEQHDRFVDRLEQEPVAFMFQHDEVGRCVFSPNDSKDPVGTFLQLNPRYHLVGPLYTTPPQRKPLSEEEIGAILEDVNAYGTRLYTFARAIEAAHGIKGEA